MSSEVKRNEQQGAECMLLSSLPRYSANYPETLKTVHIFIYTMTKYLRITHSHRVWPDPTPMPPPDHSLLPGASLPHSKFQRITSFPRRILDLCPSCLPRMSDPRMAEWHQVWATSPEPTQLTHRLPHTKFPLTLGFVYVHCPKKAKMKTSESGTGP